MTDETAETAEGADDKIIATALERFRRCADAESENRSNALLDIRFSNGDQWDPAIRAARALEQRPCLTMNKTKAFVRQVTNEQRQNRPAIKVLPVDDQADPETAQVLNGICRHVEVASNADAAYDTAFEAAVEGGWGYFRVLTQYVSDDGFDQDIRIKRIVNPFTVYLDCDAQECDASDARYGFVVEDLRREDFKRQYPDADPCSFDETQGIGDLMDWSGEDTVRVAEYFYIEDRQETLYLLEDGRIVTALDEGKKALRERRVTSPQVKWCKITCREVLERQDWAGKYIPIVPVYGDETHLDGKRVLSGLVKVLRDPAQAFNFFYTATAEQVALTPKAPFILAEGQDEGHEAEWAAANRETRSALVYKPVTIEGTLAPPPQRQAAASVPTGTMQLMLQAADDMKSVSGIYDAALGARSNETSGKAIIARGQQSQTATFHYIDNLSRAIRHGGRIIVDLIPKIYDQARVARIIGADGEPDMVQVNQPFQDKGIERLYDLGVGTYDVTVTTGPSFASRRQEASETMAQLAQADPTLMQKAGDLIVKSMDFPGADDLAKRLKLTLPPELQQDEDESPIPPQVQVQINQMQQTIEQMGQALEQAHQEVEAKDTDAQVKALELKYQEQLLGLKQQLATAKQKGEQQVAQAEQQLFEAGLTRIVDQGVARLEAIVKQAEAMAAAKAGTPAETPEAQAEQQQAMDTLALVQASAAQTSREIQQLLLVLAAPREILRDASGLAYAIQPVLQPQGAESVLQ